MKLCISLATRARPQQLIDTVTRSTANLVLPNTEFQIHVDDDDKATIAALGSARLDERVKVTVGTREDTIAEKWNRSLNTPADLYLMAADDDPYITPEYDAKMLEAAKLFPDGIGMVYGHLANLSFTCAVSCTAKWAELTGYVFPEYFPYWFVDHWTDDVARITGRISVADVRTDQSNVGKTQEMREPGWWASWFDAAHMMRRKQAFAIIDKLDEPEWRKEMQRNTAPLVEYRSRWINQGVRNRNDEFTKWSGLDTKDERYLRLRDKAVAMIPQILEDMPPTEQARYRSQLLIPCLVEAAWEHDEERLKTALGQWRE